jgi:exonuclease SbcD
MTGIAIGGRKRVRLLHCADLHLGIASHGRHDIREAENVLNQIADYVRSEGIDLLVFAGDVYHGRHPSQTQQRAVIRWLRRILNCCPVIVIPGNHDRPRNPALASTVDVFKALGLGCCVYDEITADIVCTENGDLQVVALPYLPPTYLLSGAERVNGTMAENMALTEERIVDRIKRLCSELKPDIPAILVGHLMLSSAEEGSERHMILGNEPILTPTMLAHENLDYIALGHVHKSQGYDGNINYAGSLQRVDFAEAGEPKGFWDVEINKDGLVGTQFVEVETRDFVSMELALEEYPEAPFEMLFHDVDQEVGGNVVRVNITGSREQLAAIDDNWMRAQLKDAFHVAHITKTPTERVRSREVFESAQNIIGDPMAGLEAWANLQGWDDEKTGKMVGLAKELMEEEN